MWFRGRSSEGEKRLLRFAHTRMCAMVASSVLASRPFFFFSFPRGAGRSVGGFDSLWVDSL